MDSPSPFKSTLIAQLFQQNYGWLCRRLSRVAAAAPRTWLRKLFCKSGCCLIPGAIRWPRALLATIAQRLMYESRRPKDLERAYLQVLAEISDQVHPSPHEQWMLIESPQAIDRLVDGLSGQAKTVFVLSQLEGLIYVQIGERVGLSLTRIHQLMKEALRCCYRGLEE